MGLFDNLITIATAPVRVVAQVAETTVDIASIVTKPVADVTEEITNDIVNTLKINK